MGIEETVVGKSADGLMPAIDRKLRHPRRMTFETFWFENLTEGGCVFISHVEHRGRERIEDLRVCVWPEHGSRIHSHEITREQMIDCDHMVRGCEMVGGRVDVLLSRFDPTEKLSIAVWADPCPNPNLFRFELGAATADIKVIRKFQKGELPLPHPFVSRSALRRYFRDHRKKIDVH